MRSSPYIQNLIKSAEGFRDTPYKDPGRGVLTVGYGHTKTAGQYVGQTINRATADVLFERDLLDAEQKVTAFERNNKIRLTGPQFDALVSFVFNVGHIPESIRNRIVKTTGSTVATTIKKYNRSGGQVLPGLVTRRNKEASRFNQTKKLFWLTTLLLALYVRNR